MTARRRRRADEIPEEQSAFAAVNVGTHRQRNGPTQANLGEPAPVSTRRRDEGGKARRDRGAGT